MNPIIFLDIDGVLNDHGRILNYYCGIQKDKVDRLNEITTSVGADLVISSAWRYMIIGEDMTDRGFQYLLNTHGVMADVVGHTCSDELIQGRANQITEYMKGDNYSLLNKYIVIDDLYIEGHPFIRTQFDVGLSDKNVEEVIRYFNDK